MMQVLQPILVVYEDVIQIHHYKSISEGRRISSIILIKVVGEFVKPKSMINHSKRPSFDLKAGLPYICLFYWDLVVARLHINITISIWPYDLIKEVVDSGNQVQFQTMILFRAW
jgi:hypothetical protein